MQAKRGCAGVGAAPGSTTFRAEAPFAASKEIEKLACRSLGKLGIELLEDFIPTQTAAIDRAVGVFELLDLGRRVASAAETDLVQADHLSGNAVARDEWWNVFDDFGFSAHHGLLADAAELVDCDIARDKGPVVDRDVPAQENVVHENRMRVDHAIVRDVHAAHHHVVIADDGGVFGLERGVERAVFANAVVVADGQPTADGSIGNVLRPAAEDGIFADFVVPTEGHAVSNGHAGFKPTAVADGDIPFHHAKRTDGDIHAKLGLGMDDGAGVDIGHCKIPVLG